MSDSSIDDEPAAAGTAGLLRILVVGPSSAAAAAAVAALRAAGLALEVHVAADRSELEKLLAEVRPDLTLRADEFPALSDLNGGQVFRSIVEHSTNLFYVHGPDHVLTYVSPRCREILGCEPDDALVRWTEFLTEHPVNREGFAATERAIVTGVAQPPYLLEIERPDGRRVWVEVHEAPVVREGRTVAIVGALHDISERRRAEEHVALLVQALRATAEGVCITSVDNRIQFVNKAFCDLYGYAESELLGQSVEILRVPDNPPGIGEEIVAGTLAGGWRGELWNRRKDGRRILVSLTTAPVRDERGVAAALIGVIRDVTEARCAQEKERRRTQQLTAINRVMEHVTSLMPVEELLRVAVREIRDSFNYHSVAVLLLDEERATLGSQAVEGAYAHLAAADYRQRVGEGLIGIAARDGVTVLSNNVRADARYVVGFPQPVETQSEIALPLKMGEEVLGVLDVQEARPDAFDELDVQALETVAGQLAARLEGARLLARLKEELARRQLMEEALRDALAALERSRAELERRVAERTAELEALNLRLAAEVQERAVAEEGIRASEERFRALAENSVDVIMRFDRLGRHLYVNPPVEAQTGIPVEEFLGKTHREMGFPEHLCERWEEAIQQVFNTGAPHRIEFELPNGIWIDWMLMPERDANGGVSAVITDARDITARKGMEAELERRVAARTAELAAANAALRESEERYRRFFEEDLTGDFISTPDGQLLAANQAFLDIFRFSSMEEALATNVTELYPSPEERHAFVEELRQKGRITQREVERRRRDGSPVFLVENVSGVFSASGELQALWGYLFDITERKRLEEQLREAQKMEAIGRLAGGVAHDFNNLLQAILSLGQVLAARSADPELRRTAAELEAHVRRGAELTRQLLLFSRREVARRLPLDLNGVVRDGMMLLRRLIPETIVVNVELADEAVLVEGDRGQLHQVLTNLVLNARDAIPASGTLTVTTGRGEGRVWLEVQDTGVGMDEATRARIFEPFFSTKGREVGTGLGLAVVHGIVEFHGGCVEVESAVGRGSRFRVVLPAAASQEPGERESGEGRGDLPRGHGERVLVVEDEEGARDGLRQLLELLGYEVVAVASGEAALALESGGSFHVLLTDYVLPGLDGVTLAQKLLARWPAVQVILMSGYAEDEFVRQAVASGQLRFLAKPFDLHALASEVRAALEARGARPI